MDRNEAIGRIRKALKDRSGKLWSVTGGNGTAWGWITVDAPPSRRTWRYKLPDGARDIPEDYIEFDSGSSGGHTSPDDRAELAHLMGLESIHMQGISIPASTAHYQEHVDRAEGRPPSVTGTQYWD